MSIIYRIKDISLEVLKDDYKYGIDGDSQVAINDEPELSGYTKEQVLQKFMKTYGISDFNDVVLDFPCDGCVEYQYTGHKDLVKATKDEMTLWEQGKINLYCIIIQGTLVKEVIKNG